MPLSSRPSARPTAPISAARSSTAQPVRTERRPPAEGQRQAHAREHGEQRRGASPRDELHERRRAVRVLRGQDVDRHHPDQGDATRKVDPDQAVGTAGGHRVSLLRGAAGVRRWRCGSREEGRVRGLVRGRRAPNPAPPGLAIRPAPGGRRDVASCTLTAPTARATVRARPTAGAGVRGALAQVVAAAAARCAQARAAHAPGRRAPIGARDKVAPHTRRHHRPRHPARPARRAAGHHRLAPGCR
jgi:hypothetical protein